MLVHNPHRVSRLVSSSMVSPRSPIGIKHTHHKALFVFTIKSPLYKQKANKSYFLVVQTYLLKFIQFFLKKKSKYADKEEGKLVTNTQIRGHYRFSEFVQENKIWVVENKQNQKIMARTIENVIIYQLTPNDNYTENPNTSY